MTAPRTLRINHPFVASEIIDGEAVIMNLNTGNYFSARQVGAVVWDWVEKGLSEQDILSQLKLSYHGDAATMAQGLAAFIDQLLEHELVIAAADAASAEPAAEAEANIPDELPPFRAPLLEIYSDMRDLLLLDPIHDVTDVGWPTAKPTRPAAQ